MSDINFSTFANIPKITIANVLLTDLCDYFDTIKDQFNTINQSSEDLKILEPAGHYIMLHGINRVAEDAYTDSLESLGIIVNPHDYQTTLNDITTKLTDARATIRASLEVISKQHECCEIIDRWDNVMSTLNKKATLLYKDAKKSNYVLNENKKVVGVTPSTFEHQAKQVVALTTMFNSKESIDFTKELPLSAQRAIGSLENIEYRCDSVLNLSWSLDHVRRLGDYITNYMIPNTLKFAKLVAELKQGCYNTIKDYSVDKCKNMERISFAAYRTAEVTSRLTAQYIEMVE